MPSVLARMLCCFFPATDSLQGQRSLNNDDENIKKELMEAVNGQTIPTSDFSFEGLAVYGVVVSAYDGDSCRIMFKPPWADPCKQGSTGLIRVNCRLVGIDTPEKYGPFRQKAAEAHSFLLQKTHNKVSWCKFGKPDKYGRTLVEIFDLTTGASVNQELVNAGLAVLYDGGKKSNGVPNLPNDV